MHEVGGRGLLRKRTQPFQQFRRVGMIAELFERGDFGPNGDRLAENAHFGSAVLDRSSPRPRRLESNKDHGISRIGETLHEVMQNASAGHHAAGGYDDGGKV